MKKTCDNCISRLICPTKGKVCAGHNDEKVFKGLIKLSFGYKLDTNKILDDIESIQYEGRYK